MEKLKYVRLKEYNTIIIFPLILEHVAFKHFNPITAGFCYISENKVDCYGESTSLGIKSDPIEDTKHATKQICGIDALIKLDEIKSQKST